MKIVSKFLTADVRMTRLTLRGRTVVLEGLVKEFMPMTVEVDAADVRAFLAVAAVPLRDVVARRLTRLRDRLASRRAPGGVETGH